ncbi:hypothetical protein [Metabacillus sp. 84]|uniref:hypothetical protein n=1 Tax=unclassified Metabacillus TaxID=2675274 RepID=UPI003CF5C567
MEKIISRNEIQKLLQEIEEELDKLEEKMGSAILSEGLNKEQVLSAKASTAVILMEKIERTAQFAASGKTWPMDRALAFHSPFQS